MFANTVTIMILYVLVYQGGMFMSREYLDSDQLNVLMQSFRSWVDNSPRRDVRLSRKRILLLFLLIRYTGAKLNEVLAIDPFHDIDHDRHLVIFRSDDSGLKGREVPISEVLSGEIRTMVGDPAFRDAVGTAFGVDPGFVRRKFYERALACGFPKRMGGPEMIRRSRAVELMQHNMPLPAVQSLLGHSTPNLTSSYVTFSAEDMRRVAKHFMEKESSRKTSARNSFFGKIETLQRGDIQSRVDLSTIEGHRISTVITNDSAESLGLSEGKLLIAEVKAPWVILQRGDAEPLCTAENRFRGIIEQVRRGKVNTEYVVRISDGTRLCSVVTTKSGHELGLTTGDPVWAMFNSYSVVLHVDE